MFAMNQRYNVQLSLLTFHMFDSGVAGRGGGSRGPDPPELPIVGYV